MNRHGVADRDIGWKATTPFGVVSRLIEPTPLCRSLVRIVLADLLEYVRDERAATLAEVHRVIAPGGRLTVLAPYLGPTTWMDGANWHRYLHDLRGSDFPA
ncbi:MAG: hypothetical protein R2848_09525 [Thermomicrobiales bacterium]